VCLFACQSQQPVRVYETDARRDVEFYQRVVDENPDDQYASDRLAEARQRLARHLAWDADAALARGHLHEGLRLAREAATYDEGYSDLAEHASRRVAAAHLRDAENALAHFDFDRARAQYQDAKAAAPGYLPVERFADRLNAAEAEFHRELAQEYYESGDYEGALVAISRAAALHPHDAGIVALQMRIERASQTVYVDRRVDDIRQMVIAGKLNEAEMRIDPLLEIDPDDVELRALRSRLDEQRESAKQNRHNADIAMNEGRFVDAAELLLLAMELDQSIDASIPLMEARGGIAREEMMAAMESGDRLGALLAAREALRFVQDEQIARLIPQLETAYVQESLAAARALIANNEPERARQALIEALGYIDNSELQTMLDSMNAPK